MRMYGIKAYLAVLLCCLLCLGLGGCGGFDADDAAALVQGNIDVVYQGEYTEEYLAQVEMTAEEADAVYQDALLTEAEYFAEIFDVDTELAGDEVTAKIVELYRQVYAASRYEVGAVSKNGDAYAVEVTVYPVDVFRRFIEEDSEAFMQAWRAKLTTAEFVGKTQQEIEALWAADLLAAVTKRVDTLGYLEPQVISMRVAVDSDGHYAIADDDWNLIDDVLIAY